MSLKSRPDDLDQKLIVMRQQKTIISIFVLMILLTISIFWTVSIAIESVVLVLMIVKKKKL
jgi:hypothetical protein